MNDAFTIYPAIDLRKGQVVRLQQGRANAQTTYGDDPVAVATDFAGQGARWLHVINLDGAFGQSSQNMQTLGGICQGVNVPVQFGGGLRTREDVAAAFDHGASRVILGTVALRQPKLVKRLVSEYADQIAVGIDARNGMVAVEGWVETSKVSAHELANRMFDVGVTRFIYTDIARDGMETGPDLEGAARLAETGAPVIASGGVGGLEHIRAAAAVGKGVDGLIVGKALYERRFTVRQAIEIANRNVK